MTLTIITHLLAAAAIFEWQTPQYSLEKQIEKSFLNGWETSIRTTEGYVFFPFPFPFPLFCTWIKRCVRNGWGTSIRIVEEYISPSFSLSWMKEFYLKECNTYNVSSICKWMKEFYLKEQNEYSIYWRMSLFVCPFLLQIFKELIFGIVENRLLELWIGVFFLSSFFFYK